MIPRSTCYKLVNRETGVIEYEGNKKEIMRILTRQAYPHRYTIVLSLTTHIGDKLNV